jgi:cytochrome c556
MANGLLDLLGGLGTTPPSYMEGLLGQQATQDLQKRSIGTGLANALIGYLAMPKNQNLGLGRILAGAAQAGMQGAQGVYSGAIEDYQTKAKIDEMNRQKALAERDLRRQTEMEALTPKLIKTTPAQYEDVQGQPYFTPAPTDANAVAPNYNLQTITPEPTRQLVTPEQRTIDMSVMQRIAALSKDPLATLKTTADLVPSLRKAGMLQTGQQDNPFEIYTVGAQSPTVQKLANQYAKSYQSGQIDQETADKRILELGKMEESYTGKQDTAAARKAESDRQFELRQQLANNQISQQQFNQQIAQGNLALRQQLAAGKDQKVLPAGALKMESENITSAYEANQLANQVDSQMKSLITSGIKFSPAKNAQLAIQSSLGSTSPEVLAYNDFAQFKTKLVNDTLRLNKGTQTEGDAVRAANELTNAKSTQDVIRSLQKIRDINAQAVGMQNQIVTSRRKSGGLTEDRGYSAPEQVPVPKFEPVFFGDSNEYRKLPADSVYIDGNTGVRKVKGGR